jgi:site-specific recombinase XerD
MSREAKPYAQRGWYISRASGIYLKLCPVEKGMTEAKKLLEQKLAQREAEKEQMGGRLPTKLTVEVMLALFLEDVQATMSEATYLDYQRWCTVFAQVHGGQPVGAISKAQANDFRLQLMKTTYSRGKQPPKTYSPKTVNHALITLRRAYNWAIETERLPAGRNPFAKVALLHCEGRQRVATEAEYQRLF